MNVCDAPMAKPVIAERSTYSIRKAYLQALRQFMAGKQKSISTPNPTDIEEYLLYEKQVSQHLQERLADFKLKATTAE